MRTAGLEEEQETDRAAGCARASCPNDRLREASTHVGRPARPCLRLACFGGARGQRLAMGRARAGAARVRTPHARWNWCSRVRRADGDVAKVLRLAPCQRVHGILVAGTRAAVKGDGCYGSARGYLHPGMMVGPAGGDG